MNDRPHVRIYCCGDCIHYSMKKHKCILGAKEEGPATAKFYVDCPKGVHHDSGWIPCSERLPEEEGQYLVTRQTFPEEKVNVLRLCKTAWGDHWENINGKVYHSVIAWMPLPGPFRKEETA